MKNISIILNLILFIAVGVLFYLHFSDKNPASSTSSIPAKKIAANSQNLVIAYVNSDSLVKKYSYFDKIKEELSAKKDKLEKDFQVEAKRLEGEVANYQRAGSSGSLTQEQMKATEENLMMKRQGLMQFQERLSQQLAMEEARLNDSLYNRITTYLRDYSKKNNYDIIFGYSKGAGILYAHDSLEITKNVLEGINIEYKEQQKK